MSWCRCADDAFPRFLDLFNDRFLQLFFRAWADARPIAQHDRPADDRFVAYIGSMIGLGSQPYSRSRYRSGHGQARLCRPDRAAGEIRLAAAQFLQGSVRRQGRDRRIRRQLAAFDPSRSQPARRNEHAGSARTCCSVPASSASRTSSGFGSTSRTLRQYEQFLPTGGTSAEPLADAVFFYIGDELDWDVGAGDSCRARSCRSRLGKFGRLGWTTWWRRTGRRRKNIDATPAFILRARCPSRRRSRAGMIPCARSDSMTIRSMPTSA